MDQRLFFTINRDWAQPWLDLPMAALSSWDFWWPIMLLVGILLFIFGGFHGRAAIVCTGLCIGMVDGIVMKTIKDTVGRPRPHQVLEGVRMVDLERAKPRLLALGMPPRIQFSQPRISPVRGISYPSGHAANNFTLATAIFVFYRRWGWLYFIPATMVAFSRIYVGSHYPSDILVAVVLAPGITLLTLAALEALWRRLGPRVVPKLFAANPSLIAP